MNIHVLSHSRPCLPAAALSALAALVMASGCGDDSPDAPPAEVAPKPLPLELVEVTNDYLGGRLDDERWGMGSGASAGDIDQDGDLDLFLARCDGSLTNPGGPSLLLRNDNKGDPFDLDVFASDALIESDFAGQCAHAAAFGDYDRDGALDLFVVMNGPDRLYRNDGNGAFTDVTASAGVAGPDGGLEHSVYWVDLNHDGLLDLFVPAHVTTSPPGPNPLNANRIHLNLGDGTFASVGDAAGVAGDGSTQAAAITDLDGDGDLEIYLANDQFAVEGGDPNEFGLDPDQWLDLETYDDQGVPSYRDRGAEFGVDGKRSSMGVALHDIDRDGRDEIYVTDWGTNHLSRWNPGTMRYDDESVSWNLNLTYDEFFGHLIAWGAEFSDFDRDGSDEVFVAHGMVQDPDTCNDHAQFNHILGFDAVSRRYELLTETVGWVTSTECPFEGGDRPITSRGVLISDLDSDGDDDVIITPYNEKYRFYRNDTATEGRHVLRIEPRGTVSAPTPYGAVLEITRLDGATQRQNLYAGGTTTQRYPIFKLGLLDDDTVEQAVLHWPSGYSQRLDQSPDFTVDAAWRVVEPAWLTLSARQMVSDGAVPVITYRPVDAAGKDLGAAAAGRDVVMTRSDGVAVDVTDHGDGSYSAPLSHPGTTRTTVLRVSDGAETLRPRLTVRYQ